MTFSRMIFNLLIVFFVLIQLSEATEEQDIIVSPDEYAVSVGSQVHIRCHFKVDNPDDLNRIHLEWRLKRKGDSYKYVTLHVYNTSEMVYYVHRRAWVDVSKVRQGDCSLVLNSTTLKDSGTYVLNLTINGGNYATLPEVKVLIQVRTESTEGTESTKSSDDVSSSSRQRRRLIFKIVAIISVGVMGICATGLLFSRTSYCCCCRKKTIDKYKAMEEAREEIGEE